MRNTDIFLILDCLPLPNYGEPSPSIPVNVAVIVGVVVAIVVLIVLIVVIVLCIKK